LREEVVMALRDAQVRAPLLALHETHDEEIDCLEFLESMASYAEVLALGRTPPAALSKLVEHERLCANCRKECDALVAIVRAGAH
jgi:hypothetical protein